MLSNICIYLRVEQVAVLLRIDKVYVSFESFTSKGRTNYLRVVLKSRRLSSDYLILLGDLNFDRPDAPEASVAEEAGFIFPKSLLTEPSNYMKNRPYDQIILSWNAGAEGPCVTSADVFDVFDSVYRDEDVENYGAMIETDLANSKFKSLQKKDPRKYFKHWRTSKMSDHFPKWIALDFGCR